MPPTTEGGTRLIDLCPPAAQDIRSPEFSQVSCDLFDSHYRLSILDHRFHVRTPFPSSRSPYAYGRNGKLLTLILKSECFGVINKEGIGTTV